MLFRLSELTHVCAYALHAGRGKYLGSGARFLGAADRGSDAAVGGGLAGEARSSALQQERCDGRAGQASMWDRRMQGPSTQEQRDTVGSLWCEPLNCPHDKQQVPPHLSDACPGGVAGMAGAAPAVGIALAAGWALQQVVSENAVHKEVLYPWH